MSLLNLAKPGGLERETERMARKKALADTKFRNRYWLPFYTFGPMKKLALFLGLCLSLLASAQENFSAATGASVLRNFSPQQGFWAAGQTVRAVLHFSPRQGAYAWIDYYTEGKYKNTFAATAKSPTVSPRQFAVPATGRLTYQHFSLGWNHYFKGSYRETKGLALYGMAGFGVLFARVRNTFSRDVDTLTYNVATRAGESRVRKLTFDLGLGSELPLSTNIYLFADARTWLPASSNTSPYLHSQRNVPLPVTVSGGLRVLFGSTYR